MNHNLIRTYTLLLIAITALSANAQRINLGDNSPMRKLLNAEMAISNLYVDTVNEERLVEDAIRGMLEKLDPHSSYTTAKETQQMNEPLQGSFEGIGVQFNIVEDTLLVIQPVIGGPSEKVGILAGDRIVSVNDTAIAGVKMSRENIMKRLRGKKGTKVTLGIRRRGIDGTLTFKVTRDKIPVNTIDASYMIRPKIGYIRISSFGGKTHEEFMTAVDSLKMHGMRDLIVDLQDNGGGYLQAAVKIANEFLQRGDLIVYTQGLRVPRQEFKAEGNGRLRDGRVVILTNEYSASAAEILSGAIQDQDRGTIVGRRTFGKGLVQRPLDFPDGSMIRLTVAHYYTPAGRCIQKPYVKGEKKEYAEDIEKRFKHGELYSADSIHFDDSLRCYTLRRHRTVYGGGGIMPDRFVPLDTTQYTRFHRELAAKSYIINATLKYIDKQRKSLNKAYPDFRKYNDKYQVPQELVDNLISEAAKDNVKPRSDEELQQTLPMLRLQLKALLARDLWGMSQYFEIINQQNHIVREAVNSLSEQAKDGIETP